jgi:hypothetical protein
MTLLFGFMSAKILLFRSSTMPCIACGAQLQAFGAHFASSRSLMNNPGYVTEFPLSKAS